MSVVFALAAAFCNAVNVVTQHVASIRAPRRAHGLRVIGYLFTNPLWLFGWIALGGAFVCQAVALHLGELSVVQPLLVLELVFALVLRRFWIRQDIRAVTWSGAMATSVGLALFLIAAEPHGGISRPPAGAWTAPLVVAALLVAALMLVGRSGRPGRRAALYGSATAVLWSVVAAILKVTTDVAAYDGAGGLFTHWPVYALAVTGLLAAVLNQVTLHTGPLSMSQPFLVAVDPLASIVLSVWVFGEQFTPNTGAVVLAVASFAIMCVGIVLLTRTTPALTTGETHDGA